MCCRTGARKVLNLHGGDVLAVDVGLQGDHAGRGAAVDEALIQHVVHALDAPVPAQGFEFGVQGFISIIMLFLYSYSPPMAQQSNSRSKAQKRFMLVPLVSAPSGAEADSARRAPVWVVTGKVAASYQGHEPHLTACSARAAQRENPVP